MYLESDINIPEEKYIKLLIQFAKLDLIQKVQFYIFNKLYEKEKLQKIENIELQKIAFENNITSTHGSRFVYLLFETAKENNDIDTIKWMYSVYPNERAFCRTAYIGRKEIVKFLNLPLYEE